MVGKNSGSLLSCL